MLACRLARRAAGADVSRHCGLQQRFLACERESWSSKPQAAAAPTGSHRLDPSPGSADPQGRNLALPPPAYGGGPGMGSYQPAPGRPEVTGSVAPAPQQAPPPNWSWNGGTAIIVAQGETIETISRRHHVPAHAIRQANNLAPTALIQPGQRLVIPRPAGAPVASAPQTRSAGAALYGLDRRQLTYGRARRYHLLARAPLSPDADGDRQGE